LEQLAAHSTLVVAAVLAPLELLAQVVELAALAFLTVSEQDQHSHTVAAVAVLQLQERPVLVARVAVVRALCLVLESRQLQTRAVAVAEHLRLEILRAATAAAAL
jgi:hypothetical protein